MVGVWTIEIGGTARKYKDIDLERRLKRDIPIRFSAVVEYSSDIDYFDLVEIKRDGTIEFKGFIETINIEWDETGRFLNIGGRDSTVILWKKWTENFSNLHKDTKGFFGRVSAEELIKFLLRNPNSDLPSEYPSNKSGWGMDRTRIGDCSARRTSVGDPNWVKLRRRGYGWRNDGKQFNSKAPDVSAKVTHTWNDSGVGDDPWIEDLDDTTYIYSNTKEQTDIFDFENLSTLDASASSINRCDVAVRWKPRRSIWGGEISRCEIWISPTGLDADYAYVGTFGGHRSQFQSNPYRTYTYNASHIIDTVTKADAATVKFVNKANHNVFISWCYLAINYSNDGDQLTDDYFDIPFDYDEIMGIYVESRFDNDSYPRKYKIYKVADELQDYVTDYTETETDSRIDVPTGMMDFDAAAGQPVIWLDDTSDFVVGMSVIVKDDSHEEENVVIAKTASVLKMERDLAYTYTTVLNGRVNAVHIDFNASLDTGEDAFLFKRFEADFFGSYFRHSVSITLPNVAIPDPPAGAEETKIILGFWCVANENTKDLKELIDDEDNHISLSIWKEAGGTAHIRLGDQDVAVSTVDYSLAIAINKTYACEIIRDEGVITVKITEDGTEFDTITVTMNDKTNKFRDLFGCISADQGRAQAYEVDIDELILETETDLLDGEVTNTFRDIIHSWNPQEMEKIRIRITTAEAGKAWVISQVYVYPSVDFMLRTYRDVETATDLTAGALAEQKIIYVTNSDSYNALDIVTIKEGSNQEVNQVDSKDGLKITMVYDLVYDYTTDADLYKGFPPEQYITAFDFEAPEYTTAIGPLNLPRGRLIDQINIIMEKCEESYLPYEWWLALDAPNTFHMKSERTSSPSVSFVKGANLGGTKKITGIVDTVQRLKLLGQGEDQRQEEISSDWAQDKTEMINVNTFFEEVISDKSVIDSDIADIIANVRVTEEAPPNTQITCKINNDVYVSMAYDVGDKVTVTDSLTGASGLYKIYNIMKKITKDGEKVTIVVNSPYKNKEDEWHDIYKRLKMIEIFGATAADWSGEATNEGKVDAQDALTTIFEKEAKNDTIEEAKGVRDPKWKFSTTPDAYTAPVNHQVGAGTAVAEFYDWNATQNNMKFSHTNDKMQIWGPDNATGIKTLKIEMAGEANDRIDVPLTKNPKLVAELKFVKKSGAGAVDWREGDIFEIGMYDVTSSTGYFIRFTRGAGDTLSAEAVWNETGSDEETLPLETIIVMSDIETGSDNRYKIEIIVDSKEEMVFFNIYDLQFDPPQEYPTSVVRLGMDIGNSVRPLYMGMMADNNSEAGVLARTYIYYFKSEWEKVQ